MKRKTLLFVGLFLLQIPSIFSMGLGEWSYETKNKTYIIGDGGVFIENRRNRIAYVKKWYFYKDHIIGINTLDKYKTGHEPKESYFILNEVTGKFVIFKNIKEWRFAINQNDLKPNYTRWYTEHFNGFLLLILVYSVYYPFIFIPIYLLLLLVIFKFFKEVFFRERFNLEKPFTQIFLFLSLLIIGSIFLNNYVQSF